jgi:hypothetical protein
MGSVLMQRGAPALGFVVAAAAALGCGPSGVEVQTLPPEIEALNDAYDAPTGTVPPSAMQPILALQATLDTIARSRAVDLVDRALGSLRTRVQEGGLATSPLTTPKKDWPIISGFVTITQTCRGWDPTSTAPNPADGTIQLVAQFDRSVLQRTILGTASGCRGRVDLPGGSSLNVFLDGAIALFLQGPLPANGGEATYLMSWSGTIGTASSQVQTSFDFRVTPPLLEVRVPVADGDVIGSVSSAGQVTLRGANGTFGCSSATFECAAL